MLMPQYERRGRPLDAILIECCAQMTDEETDDSNPFLGRMFLYGLEAWDAEQNAARDAVLREAGFPIDREAGLEANEPWIKAAMADSEAMARLQRLLDAHPELDDAAADTGPAMVRDMIELLDHEDSARLMLGVEELRPWKTFLLERLQAMTEAFGLPEPGAQITRAQRNKGFDQFYLPALEAITKGIFTVERIRRLVAGLQEYRQALEGAGDKSSALRATTAILYVAEEREPETNEFLVSLCARSLKCASAALSQEVP